MDFKLDKEFKPAIVELNNFKEDVKNNKHKPLVIAIDRDNNEVYHYHIDIFSDGVDDDRNKFIIERIVKTLLWVVGGYRIYICGSKIVYEHIKNEYSTTRRLCQWLLGNSGTEEDLDLESEDTQYMFNLLIFAFKHIL
ncbi:MAG: hypothetical protein MJ199_02510, partial [Bacilli bacterium]|nr:hypothetical protein [Bacilli bacterium]